MSLVKPQHRRQMMSRFRLQFDHPPVSFLPESDLHGIELLSCLRAHLLAGRDRGLEHLDDQAAGEVRESVGIFREALMYLLGRVDLDLASVLPFIID
ncbi:MAG: hypothetical protein Q9159_003628 [Coniocarpon cinnabarinum]